MKSTVLKGIIFLIAIPFISEAQWTYLGLWDKPVHEFKIENNWLFAGTDFGLFKKQLNNSDTSWSLMGFEGTRIRDFIIFSEDTVLICKDIYPSSGDTVSLYITYNGGISWSDFQNGFGVDLYSKRCSGLEKASPGTNAIFARTGSCVAKSQNNGISWQLVHGQWENTSSASRNLFNFYSNGTCWAGGSTGYFTPYLLRSYDFGNSWESVSLNYPGSGSATLCLLQNKTNNNEILLGIGNTMLKSYDSANTWEYSFNYSPHEFFFDLKYSVIDDSLIYAASIKVLTQFDNLIVFYGSNNFGESWDPIDSLELPPQQHGCHLEILKENQAEYLYIATSTGIYMYSSSVGINEPLTDEQGYPGFIYPNPLYSTATIKLYNSQNEFKTLKIFNIQGALVRPEIHFITDQIVVERNSLKKGLYLFTISSASGKCFNGKFIVE